MCLKVATFVGSPRPAWKVVEIVDGYVYSPYYRFSWKIGENVAMGGYKRFEGFAKRSDARKLKRVAYTGKGKYTFKIIKVLFTSAVVEGKVDGLALCVDGVKGLGGSVAIWDGKFHR